MIFKAQIRSFFFCVTLIIGSLQALGQEQSVSKDRLVGSILKNALETYHYTKKKIDDNVSENAFDEFLKKVDYGKQFLLAKDIKELEKFRFKIDDQVISGNHSIIKIVQKKLKQNISATEKYRVEIFKKGFDF